MHNEDTYQRKPQESHGEEKTFRDLLAAASDVARSVLASVQTLAGTTSCKGVQIHALHKFALANGCWFDDEFYFIDTIIYRSEDDNLKTYRSLSPRFTD